MMIYLDASALVKRYSDESGAEELARRLSPGVRPFTSSLTFAEVHAALARKFREGGIDRSQLDRIKASFTQDWASAFSVLEVDTTTMSALPDLVSRFPLKASDAVHLSAAIWLRDHWELESAGAGGDRSVEFYVADKALASVAAQCGMRVFNPESPHS